MTPNTSQEEVEEETTSSRMTMSPLYWFIPFAGQGKRQIKNHTLAIQDIVAKGICVTSAHCPLMRMTHDPANCKECRRTREG